ncbi:hypothetical protein BSZ35_02035 [Salinibacter sp. 10B]|uniref:hypothetical protein n=1 Tax=Salinibacter sp. 10B TaxID=1923971 RepID=UPI000CF3D9C1|nr:hypothetical protein [Salinibacter sp. 10B]PQJ33538.1 hypothetical protein BSZ35_02035 [Salinibacter sp. 10B]
MEDILVPLGFFGMIAYIAKLIGDTRIRRKALDSHASADVAEAILNRRWKEPSTRSALKWGLIVVALGIGVLLVDLLTIGFESPLAYAILLLATGMALLGYYFVERETQLGEAPSHNAAEESFSASDPVRESEM